MDKSALYIRMCKKAKEVQQLWMPTHGDFYEGEHHRICCWIGHLNNLPRVKKGFGFTVDHDVVRMTRFIWLPRLNQLIEMAQEKTKRYDVTTQDFFDWTKTPSRGNKQPAKCFSSLEQLWLAFVMHRKFSKKWDESNWIVDFPGNGKSSIPVFRIDL